MIRVLIADDQVIVCEGLKVVLNATGSIQVVDTVYDGAAAVESTERLRPNLVLMDLKMPIMNGVRATQIIRERFPEIPVLVLTTYDEDEWVIDAIRAGASGYLLKDSTRDDLIAAVEGIVAGKTHIDPAVAGKVFQFVRSGSVQNTAALDVLNERERSILRLMASGLTNAAIAERLNLAEGTVRNHITTIFVKLDVTDRAQATALAWRYGLMKSDV
jgi:two-component system, NarL family, response regulator LiaR